MLALHNWFPMSETEGSEQGLDFLKGLTSCFRESEEDMKQPWQNRKL